MFKTKSTRAARPGVWIDVCLLSLTIYFAIFLHFRSFGVYEDDLTRITPNFGATPGEFHDMLMSAFAWQEKQGHPLHDILIYTFAFLGWKVGGFAAVYCIGIAILVLNAALVYFLLLKISKERLFALAGALTFCLYPADTTRAFLNHALGVQISMTFLLAACHLYLSGRRMWSYLFALLMLLTYETFFPVFLAMPLVVDRWDRRTLRALLRHAAILLAMLAVDLLARRSLHEGRAAGLTIGSVLVGALNGVREGPLTVLAIFIHAPREVIERLARVPPLEMAAGFAVSCAVFAWALWRYQRPLPSAATALTVDLNLRVFRIAMTAELYRLVRLAVLGFLMTALAYTLSLSLAAAVTRGRATRVHAPAALGAAILGGCAVCAALHLAEAYGRRRAVTAVAALSFATLFCVGLTVQADFIEAWKLQKDLWLNFSGLAAHMEDSDVFLVEPIGHTDAIAAFSWNMAFWPESIYRLPKNWKNPPRAFIFDDDWKARFCTGKELFAASGWIPRDLPSVPPGYRDAPPKLKLIALQNGRLIQRSNVCGPSTAQPVDPAPVPFSTKPFYAVLLP